MSLEPPQFNVPLTNNDRLTPQGYAVLKGFYDALALPQTSVLMQSPNGTRYVVTVTDGGALSVAPE